MNCSKLVSCADVWSFFGKMHSFRGASYLQHPRGFRTPIHAIDLCSFLIPRPHLEAFSSLEHNTEPFSGVLHSLVLVANLLVYVHRQLSESRGGLAQHFQSFVLLLHHHLHVGRRMR